MWKHDYAAGPHKPPKPAKHRRRFPPEVLTNPEVMALMDACGRHTMTAIRNRALIAVLYRSGLRINEALALHPKDIDLEAGAVRVMHGKGNKTRITGIDGGAIVMLQEWLVARQRWGVNGSHVVFCTRTGRPLIDGFVRRWFSQLAKKADILKRVHAHGFRHTHAAELRSEGVDIGIISKQLGHASISTTAKYLDHIAPTAVVNAIRARAW